MRKHIRAFANKLIAYEQSSTKFALTVCLGTYIGISPLIGLHTLLLFFCAWLFTLNLGTLFAVSFIIHNPWTTIPIYTIDHLFGQWIFNLCNIDGTQWDPAWIEWCNEFLYTHVGISGVSLSAFLVGGNLLAIGISVIMYPIAKRLFEAYITEKVTHSTAEVGT
jgi:uncharacterized protein (DUF2062 family)